MDYLAEKFARLGTANAPGQEGLQKAEDLPMIAEIEKLSFHRPWSFDSIEAFYYRKTSDIYVWRDRNRISGYIIAEHVLD